MKARKVPMLPFHATPEQKTEWVLALLKLGLNYHPDNEPTEYVDMEGKQFLSPTEAERLGAMTKRFLAHEYDPYAHGVEAMRRFHGLGKNPPYEEHYGENPKNLCGKMRGKDDPYEVWKSRDGSWEWRVLKKWQADDDKPYARWFCAVKSPFTQGEWDMGDTYVADIKRHAVKVDPSIIDAALRSGGMEIHRVPPGGSYKAEVWVEESWVGNALRFTTEIEAGHYGNDLMGRWSLVKNVRVLPSKDPVNASFLEGALKQNPLRGMSLKSITIKREIDSDPDLSYLGKFSMTPGKFAIHHSDDSHHFRFFNPENVSNMKEAKGNYQVMLDYEEQRTWDWIIRAEAEVKIMGTIQRISSGSIGGVNQGDESHVSETEKEQLDELVKILVGMGFTTHDVETVKVERKETR